VLTDFAETCQIFFEPLVVHHKLLDLGLAAHFGRGQVHHDRVRLHFDDLLLAHVVEFGHWVLSNWPKSLFAGSETGTRSSTRNSTHGAIYTISGRSLCNHCIVANATHGPEFLVTGSSSSSLGVDLVDIQHRNFFHILFVRFNDYLLFGDHSAFHAHIWRGVWRGTC
jgi:hypothetical protein